MWYIDRRKQNLTKMYSKKDRNQTICYPFFDRWVGLFLTFDAAHLSMAERRLSVGIGNKFPHKKET